MIHCYYQLPDLSPEHCLDGHGNGLGLMPFSAASPESLFRFAGIPGSAQLTVGPCINTDPGSKPCSVPSTGREPLRGVTGGPTALIRM